MRLKMIIAVLARLNFFVGLTMLAPIAFALTDNNRDLMPLIYAMLATLFVSSLCATLCKTPKNDITHREGMVIVSLGWASAGFFGALPFVFAQVFGPLTFNSVTNAYFESISGFTTTGASVLGTYATIESLSQGLLFWRSLTHWLGGMGIIVLAVAILPLLGVGGMQLFHAESPGPTKEKLRPRIRETAATLWMVYVGLSIIETILLMLSGMSLFDALCHTFGTMATGGFSTKNTSVGAYNSALIDAIILVFMFLAGTNFSLHYLALTGRLKAYWQNSEFRYYLAITIVSIIVFTAYLFFSNTYTHIFDALRFGSFQSISIITTTGFATADFKIWPTVLQVSLLIFMFFGGCAGSTGGSVKIVRLVMLCKYAYRELFRLVHPKSFAAVKLSKRVVHKDILESIAGFFIIYMGIFVCASIILSALGLDLVTAFSSVAATLGNIGPGLGSVGPMDNYHHIPTLGKAILCFCMVLGRLEIYTVLVLLIPEFWKK